MGHHGCLEYKLYKTNKELEYLILRRYITKENFEASEKNYVHSFDQTLLFELIEKCTHKTYTVVA